MKKLFFLITLGIFPHLIEAQQQETIKQIERIASAYEEVHGFSGTIKIVLDDKEVWQNSFGMANRSFQIPNTPTTRMSINSISKTFTATLIIKLVEDGQLSLDQPISTYIPELTAEWADSVTIHHLLTHTSGLPREAGMKATDELSFQEQIHLVDKLDLLFEPGERYQYSNAGFLLLGPILEKVTGRSYIDLIQETVINPLALENTGVYQGKSIVERQATPYKIGAQGIEEVQRTKTLGESAGGGLYSTLDDLYKYTLALETRRILDEKFQELLFQKHIQLSEGEFEGYAWSIKQFGADEIRMAAGSGYGTKSVIIREPESGLFIGILSNYGNTPILDILRDLYLSLKGETISPPSAENLANPEDYKENFGTYIFDPDKIKTYLQKEDNRITIKNIDGKLFMDDELLAKKSEGKLGLTYTDEILIHFLDDRLYLKINENQLIGEKLIKR